MRIKLRSRFRDYEIWDCFEVCDTTSVKQFTNSETALTFLRTFQDDYFAISALRDIVTESYCCSNARNLSDYRVLEIVASGLAEGRLKFAERRPVEIRGGGATPRTVRDSEEVPFEPVPKPVVEEDPLYLDLEVEIEKPLTLELETEIPE